MFAKKVNSMWIHSDLIPEFLNGAKVICSDLDAACHSAVGWVLTGCLFLICFLSSIGCLSLIGCLFLIGKHLRCCPIIIEGIFLIWSARNGFFFISSLFLSIFWSGSGKQTIITLLCVKCCPTYLLCITSHYAPVSLDSLSKWFVQSLFRFFFLLSFLSLIFLFHYLPNYWSPPLGIIVNQLRLLWFYMSTFSTTGSLVTGLSSTG